LLSRMTTTRAVSAAALLLLGPCDALIAGAAAGAALRARVPSARSAPLAMAGEEGGFGRFLGGLTLEKKSQAEPEPEPAKEVAEEEWTLDKVASLGLAGVLSIAVAETVFWVLSFPISEVMYFLSTGEWINLLEQEGQLKFLAFSAGWGALGGVIAQYRTVLTAAAMTPWMDANVVKPYLNPLIEQWKGEAK